MGGQREVLDLQGRKTRVCVCLESRSDGNTLWSIGEWGSAFKKKGRGCRPYRLKTRLQLFLKTYNKCHYSEPEGVKILFVQHIMFDISLNFINCFIYSVCEANDSKKSELHHSQGPHGEKEVSILDVWGNRRELFEGIPTQSGRD